MEQPTKEESDLLVSMLLEATRKEISESIKKNWITSSTIGMLPQNVEGLSAIMAQREVTRSKDRIKDELRDKPFEDMPLYVNDPDLLVRITAVWRMRIGK